jgi:hypothetical protein
LFYFFVGKLSEILDESQSEKFADKLLRVWDDFKASSRRRKRKVYNVGLEMNFILTGSPKN